MSPIHADSREVSSDEETKIKMSRSQLERFLLCCVASQRMVILLLQFVAGRFDFSTDAFKGVANSSPSTIVDHLVRSALTGLTRWDSLHFLHIAEHDYVFETSLAFFPLFPVLVRVLTHCWASPFLFLGFLHNSTAFVITGVALNFFFFILSSLLLFRLSLRLTASLKVSALSVLLFSLNPASIFFSAFYTESLFFCLTLSGISVLLCRDLLFDLRLFIASLVFLLSFLTRSNGVLNLGYIMFYAGLEFVTEPGRPLIYHDSFSSQLKRFFSFCVRVCVAGCLLLPSSLLQSAWHHSRFCSRLSAPPSPHLIAFARSQNLLVAGDPVQWCSERSLLLPIYYSSIQRRHWDVSLFGYWQFKKIPCFLLAAPSFLLVVFCSSRVVRRLRNLYFNDVASLVSSSGDLLPFCVHAVFLSVSAALLYNVEVLTRIVFSATPFLYIETARWMAEITPQARLSDLAYPSWLPFFGYFVRRGGLEALLVLYFLLYFVLGTVLHASFLPFT